MLLQLLNYDYGYTAISFTVRNYNSGIRLLLITTLEPIIDQLNISGYNKINHKKQLLKKTIRIRDSYRKMFGFSHSRRILYSKRALYVLSLQIEDIQHTSSNNSSASKLTSVCVSCARMSLSSSRWNISL